MNEYEENTLLEKKRRIPEIEISEEDSFDYGGFQVVRGEFFSHIYEPTFTLNKNKVAVNTACIRKLPDVEYVQILVNPDDRKLAVKPCPEEEKDSVKWCSAGKKRGPKQITCRIFYAKVIELMGWNPNNRYKLLGKLIRSNDELLFVFDLDHPEIYRPTSKEGERLKMSRTPTYPAEWQNQFGLTVEEHRKKLQINIFDDVAVFGIQERKEPQAMQQDAVESEVENERHYDSETSSMY